jgi:acetylornithine deacetylase
VHVAPALDDAELLRRLVAFDTTSRNSNLPIADYICEYLDRPGIRIARNPSPDGRKTNLVLAAGPAGLGSGGLALSGHMDVVPAEEPDWKTDPFTLATVDGQLVGRGAADMKGFLALAINALAALDPGRLRLPLALLLTYDEELGTLGARHFVETWAEPEELPKSAIIGEPTSLAVVRMHKGYLKMRFEVTGQAAHSGYPHLGTNAIEPAARAIVALGDLRAALERERPAHSEHFPDVPYAALNVATVAGGVAINVIPDRCRVELGVRLLPGMASKAMVDTVRATVRGAVGDAPWAITVLGESPAMLLPEDAPLHRMLCGALGQTETVGVSFATDAGWFQALGIACVVCGPGSITTAHRANEHLPVSEFHRAGQLIRDVVRRWCVDGAAAR